MRIRLWVTGNPFLSLSVLKKNLCALSTTQGFDFLKLLYIFYQLSPSTWLISRHFFSIFILTPDHFLIRDERPVWLFSGEDLLGLDEYLKIFAQSNYPGALLNLGVWTYADWIGLLFVPSTAAPYIDMCLCGD